MSSVAANGPAVRTRRIRALAASTVGTTIEWYDFLPLRHRRDVRAAPSRFDETLDRAPVREAEGASAGPGHVR
jgi:hypothetical protein